jgi:hypothetical protein
MSTNDIHFSADPSLSVQVHEIVHLLNCDSGSSCAPPACNEPTCGPSSPPSCSSGEPGCGPSAGPPSCEPSGGGGCTPTPTSCGPSGGEPGCGPSGPPSCEPSSGSGCAPTPISCGPSGGEQGCGPSGPPSCGPSADATHCGSFTGVGDLSVHASAQICVGVSSSPGCYDSGYQAHNLFG